MPKFQVSATDNTGKDKQLLVEAATEAEALAKVKLQGLFATKVKVATSVPRNVPEFDDAPTGPQRFRYKMLQIPPNISVQEGSSTDNVAAAFLQHVVNEHSKQGWDFFRVDSIGVTIYPGCLAKLFGVGPST